MLRLVPGYDPYATAAPGDWFDAATAQRAVDFIQECLVFIEGEKAGRPFVLEPWQKAIVGNLFGWQRADGTRRYREALVYVPRKSGKTPMLAAILLYVLFCDGEPGAQIYSAAAEREQAGLVFRHAAGMIAREPELERRAKVFRSLKSIEYPEESVVYKALSSDADTKHGFNSHFIVVDELHAHKDRELVDVLKTSTGSRRQPLVVYITTADYDRESICNEIYDRACQVRDGKVADRAFLPVIYEAKPEDDWTDPAVWAKANPNLGVSIPLDYLARECEEAKRLATYANTFRRLHLNQRTRQQNMWLQMDQWDACRGEGLSQAELVERLKGRPCWGGLDLSNTRDLSAFALIFPSMERSGGSWVDDGTCRYDCLVRFWVPGDGLGDRPHPGRLPYREAERLGYVTITPGNSIDYGTVRADVLEWVELFDFRDLGADPWNATQILTQFVDEDGLEVVQFRQGYASMSAPSKELERVVAAGLLRHHDNPILRWMASNCAVDSDPSGNIKPVKPAKNSPNKVDGIVALAMALGRAMVRTVKRGSVYERRGIIGI